MFTGIITNLGLVKSINHNQNKDLLLEISTRNNLVNRKTEIGCSIAINGICLTLTKKELTADDLILSFQASDETCQKTTLQNWNIDQIVNMEFALRIGDELGGHMVLGHVDATAKIKNIKSIADSHKFTFEAPNDLLKFIAEKGSITIDGTSLTINNVLKNCFDVNIIEHTIKNTAFKNAAIDNLVNLEIDAMARYAAKILQQND